MIQTTSEGNIYLIISPDKDPDEINFRFYSLLGLLRRAVKTEVNLFKKLNLKNSKYHKENELWNKLNESKARLALAGNRRLRRVELSKQRKKLTQ